MRPPTLRRDMFNKPRSEEEGLQKAIDELLIEMELHSATSDEYANMADQLSKLYSLKEFDSKRRVSPDTLAVVIGNIIGIGMIVGHERAHVVTSKALNFIMKLR